MSDFYQTGVVATLHRLTQGGTDRLERDLDGFSRVRPIGLVLPALYSEFQHPAMDGILRELREVRYLRRVVVAIGGCDRQQFEESRARFRRFRVPVTAIWMEAPEILELFDLLEAKDLSIGKPGKGRTCWLSFGYILACGDCDILALHDCDIRKYDRDLLARLVYPVGNPNLGFEFSKGYYARVADRLYGRVTRLFFTPLIRAIMDMSPGIPYLKFLDSFRYALAGEFAMTADLARVIRIPCDWGLEVGTLSEVYRNCAVSRVCQVDLSDNYEHKHKDLSPDNPQFGLRRMTLDIAKSVFRTIAQEGVAMGADQFRALQLYYTRFAQDTIRRYYADAVINSLQFDLDQEDSAVTVFAKSLREAAAEFLEDPLGAPQLPNWNRVVAAVPDIFMRLRDSVSELHRGVAIPQRAIAFPA
jgi:glucosyl-3-phosphoglycerate synthase